MTDIFSGNLNRLFNVNIIAAILAFYPADSFSEYDWKPAKTKDGIATSIGKVEGSKYRAVRGETILSAPIAQLVAVINDAAACPEWADMCKESYVFEQISHTETYIYTHNDLPWPVKDRDVLAHILWSKGEDGTVTMNSVAVQEKLDKKSDIVRIETATALWKFTPLENGTTQTIFEIHMDPNGPIPGWLLNRLVVNSPFTTFKNLEKQAAKPKYQNATLLF